MEINGISKTFYSDKGYFTAIKDVSFDVNDGEFLVILGPGRCGKTVLACATYDGFLFPPMENLLAHLKTKAFQSRTIALMENGTWAPMAAKLMRAELEGMKNITVCDTVVTLRSASNPAAEAQMDALAEELLAK